MAADTPGALAPFHPLVRSWFLRRVGSPTEVQELAWPVIARGDHVLVSAPTGTGKTLAAFLWGIDRLLAEAAAPGSAPAGDAKAGRPGRVRILYVSPLKALNADIRRNLLGPLEELREEFRQAGQEFPGISVLTRSGDTPAADRRRMLAHPPEILITTPESLNLIISGPTSRFLLDSVTTVILDEVHAVAGTKRGTHLATAVERLVPLAGEFQRIALSATVKPLAAVADLVGGWRVAGHRPASFEKRRVHVVRAPGAKSYDISIAFPSADAPPAVPGPDAAGEGPGSRTWEAVAARCREVIAASRSTLLFVNSRRNAEKLARLVNEGAGRTVAWAHHGSLSREIRLVVEERLKRGELGAIVATSSLELGIDIGSLDRVVLVQTPFSVSSAVQRIGRAGHAVGERSAALLLPLHPRDILEAAVTARAVVDQDIESVRPVQCPLDVLAQVVVSMTGVEEWKLDDLYDAVRASEPFHELPRRQFDLVLAMLGGRYGETRLRELYPMVSVDHVGGTVRAREGARMRLAASGGTIPDRGYLGLRTAGTKALLGELDEEFVWERSVGDTFLLGTQAWRIQSIGHQDVEVVPAQARTAMSPFWKAEERNGDFHAAGLVSRALEEWDPRVGTPAFAAEIAASHRMEEGAARTLAGFLARQKEAGGGELPHRHHLLVEHPRQAAGPSGGSAGFPVVLHTLWGGRVNRPFGLALAAAWQERWGEKPALFQDDDTILIVGSGERAAADITALVRPENIERLLRRSLEASGFFGARFRENAARALLLPRAAARRRTPLWLTRQRAKALLQAVSRFDDFPILLETWRTCLRDEFDMDSLVLLLGEVADGTIRVSEVVTQSASPFCADIVRRQANALMYADDTPLGGATALAADLVREAALSPGLRPRVQAAAARALEARLARTADGYAPRDAREVLDLLKERVLVPRPAWEALLAAVQREAGIPPARIEEDLAGRVGRAPSGALAAEERLPWIRRCLAEGSEELAADLVAEVLRSYGPVQPPFLADLLGLPVDRVSSVLDDLAAQEAVVVDTLLEGDESLLACDRENLERLLRMQRAARAARPAPSLPAERLPLFAALHHGLLAPQPGMDGLQAALERLFGVALPARLWEEEVLPARVAGYAPRLLDQLMRESGLLWFGAGRQRIGFCLPGDAELFISPPTAADRARCDALFPGRTGKYAFWDLVPGAARLPAPGAPQRSAQVAAELWSLAWKGAVTNDSLQPLRRGLEIGFDAEPAALPGSGRRTGRLAWQASRPAEGSWSRIDHGEGERDAVDEEEASRDRARQVLRRHGVVFRELLENELPLLAWSRLFRSLRLMELSGEVVAGRFFEGVRGIQFALPGALDTLSAAAGPGFDDAVYWMNAADPASAAGVAVEELKAVLPPRLATTHVVFHGAAVALVSRRRGRDLEFRVPAGSPVVPRLLAFVRALAGGDEPARAAVHVETVNGLPASSSPYASALLEFGFVADFRRLTWRPKVSGS